MVEGAARRGGDWVGGGGGDGNENGTVLSI